MWWKRSISSPVISSPIKPRQSFTISSSGSTHTSSSSAPLAWAPALRSVKVQTPDWDVAPLKCLNVVLYLLVDQLFIFSRSHCLNSFTLRSGFPQIDGWPSFETDFYNRDTLLWGLPCSTTSEIPFVLLTAQALPLQLFQRDYGFGDNGRQHFSHGMPSAVFQSPNDSRIRPNT